MRPLHVGALAENRWGHNKWTFSLAALVLPTTWLGALIGQASLVYACLIRCTLVLPSRTVTFGCSLHCSGQRCRNSFKHFSKLRHYSTLVCHNQSGFCLSTCVLFVCLWFVCLSSPQRVPHRGTGNTWHVH